MATSADQPHALKLAVIITLVLISSHLPFKSAGWEEAASSYSERKKMVLGSKPPGCVNKCLNCRPCMATLVIPPHQNKALRDSSSSSASSSSSSSSRGEDDDNYYLLLWKCRCGDKLFQP